MKLANRATSQPSVSRRAQAAFTLAEMLAAMVFLAIVIPVVIEGLSICSRAADVSYRKIIATRIAERLINEALISQNSQNYATATASRYGNTNVANIQFSWKVQPGFWKIDTRNQIQQYTAEVNFQAQNHNYAVELTTLVGNR